MISSDVRDILEIESSGGKELTAKEKKRLKRSFEPIKRPVGVNREVWGLIRKDDMRDQPPLIPTDEPKLYKQPKAKFRYGVRKWKWIEFKNPARTDNALFSHWRCVTDEIKEYPFAKLNKKINLPTYTDQEYNQYLMDDNWSKLETDYLFSLCAKYDLRFFVIHDRWDTGGFNKSRTIDEIKDRYYRVVGTLEKLRTSGNGDDTAATAANNTNSNVQQKEVFVFDLEHEQKRREQLDKLFKRTKEQIEEEQYLLDELKKIEIRKKERERKSQDVNKLLTAAVDLEPILVQQPQQSLTNGGLSLNKANLNNSTIAGRRTKQRKSSIQQQSSTDLNNSSTSRSPTNSTNNNGLAGQNNQAAGDLSKDKSINKKSLIFKASVESGGIKFPDNKTAGVSLRSYKMKLPPSVGSKKTKAIETLLEQFQIESRPMARDSVCEQFNDLRSDMVLLYELNQALTNCDFELQTLRHRYEAINPGKSIEMASLETSASSNTSPNLTETPQKRISDVFEISVTPTVPLERRRKAALNQSNILKKLRGRSTT